MKWVTSLALMLGGASTKVSMANVSSSTGTGRGRNGQDRLAKISMATCQQAHVQWGVGVGGRASSVEDSSRARMASQQARSTRQDRKWGRRGKGE